MNESLAETIRRKIASGALQPPRQTTYTLSMQLGKTQHCHTCAGCDRAFEPTELCFELRLPDEHLCFDAACLTLWYAQRTGAVREE